MWRWEQVEQADGGQDAPVQATLPPALAASGGEMLNVWWQRRLEEVEEEKEERERVLEEVMRRSEWKVFTHSWEEAQVTVESTFCSVGALVI